MFSKKKPAPTTVSEAIQPFRDVQSNLSTVLDAHIARKGEAARRIADAKSYAAQVEKDETAASEAAQAEIAQAEKISAALFSLLGDNA